MKVTPISQQIFVKLAKRKKITDTGIYLPDAGKEVLWGGLVVEVATDEDIVEKGDSLFFNKYSDKKLVWDNEELSVVKKKDIIAIIRGKELIPPKDMVIVKVHLHETIGVVVIPEQMALQQYHSGFYGEVYGIGPDYPYDIKKGDRVSFRRHEGKAFKFQGEDFISLKEKWVEGLFVRVEEIRRK